MKRRALIASAAVVLLSGVAYYMLVPSSDDVAFAAVKHCELLELLALAEQGPISDDLAEGLRNMRFHVDAALDIARAPGATTRALRTVDCERVPEFDWTPYGGQPR